METIFDFRTYLSATILLVDVFSQSCLQWMLYDNAVTGERGITYLYEQIFGWNKPILVGEDMRPLSTQEKNFFADVFTIERNGGDFETAFQQLANKYPLKDHFKRPMDSITVKRTYLTAKMADVLNQYYRNRKYNDVSPATVRKIIEWCVKQFRFGSNIEHIILSAIEDAGLYNKLTKPIEWGIILKDMIHEDPAVVVEYIKELQIAQSRFRSPKFMHNDMEYQVHSGTMF